MQTPTLSPDNAAVPDPEAIRAIIAELLGLSREQAHDAYALGQTRVASSLGRAAWNARFKRECGREMAFGFRPRTVGELIAHLRGDLSAETPSGATQTPALASGATLIASDLRCGTDIQALAELPQVSDFFSHEFYRTHFSPAEIGYCSTMPDPRPHFAARWAAKEAALKCDPALASLSFSEMEVSLQPGGGVILRRVGGEPLALAVSLSHSGDYAFAVAVARRDTGMPSHASTHVKASRRAPLRVLVLVLVIGAGVLVLAGHQNIAMLLLALGMMLVAWAS